MIFSPVIDELVPAITFSFSSDGVTIKTPGFLNEPLISFIFSHDD